MCGRRCYGIPLGRAATYSDVARNVCSEFKAAPCGRRGREYSISFVVPCHRVVGKNGNLTGYHWGITRKRAMLGWEAGKVA